MATVARKGLERAGFAVEVARSGADGILRVVQGAFDLLLLDWRLGDMTGGEVLRVIRGAGVTVPVIVLSGYDERDAALSLGANAFERKPFRMAAMYPVIERLLGGEPTHVGDIGRRIFNTWTLRTISLFDRASAALEFENDRLDASGQRNLLRQLGHALADSDATIPEFRTGSGAFKLIVESTDRIDRFVLAEAWRLITVLPLDRTNLHNEVFQAIDYLESAGPGAHPIREGIVAHEFGVASGYLGELFKKQTGLSWDDWSIGAHVRDSTRRLVADGRTIGASAITEWGWSSRQHFHRSLAELIGVGPRRFRSIVVSPTPVS